MRSSEAIQYYVSVRSIYIGDILPQEEYLQDHYWLNICIGDNLPQEEYLLHMYIGNKLPREEYFQPPKM